MKDLITLVLEKSNIDNFSRIYINAANCAKQIKIYVNIEEMDMFEINELIEIFSKIRRNKQAKSELILYSFTPLGEDVIGVLVEYKIEYFYCGKLSNYALTILSNLKRLSNSIPVVAINCDDNDWFDYALWAIQYNNRIFFYNLEKIEPNLFLAFLLHQQINENNIVNYKTIQYLIEHQASVSSLVTDSLFYINDIKIYDSQHNFLGNITSNLLFDVISQEIQVKKYSEKCDKCNLKKLCYNFNIGIVDIACLKNCDLLKKLVSLVMIKKDEETFYKNDEF